jgi:hypothetical protein
MPYPQNLAMATQVQDIIREQGCVPATIAISGGKFNIGLTDKELEYFAKKPDIMKASRRDVPILLAQVSHSAHSWEGRVWSNDRLCHNDGSTHGRNICLCDRWHWWSTSECE